MGYDYDKMILQINELVKNNSFVDMFSIGESVMERKIPCIVMGHGKKKIFINGAHHGLEYLTSAFIVKFFFEYAKAYKENSAFLGYNPHTLFDNASLYAVPMVNPDGVDIAVNGIDITNPYHRDLISKVGIHSFNKVWQANANGVDINHNYNANWQVVNDAPSPSKYAGPNYESEPETRAIVEFVKNNNFDILIAFHSQGEEIYYDFDGSMAKDSLDIVNRMSHVSGYRAAIVEGTASFGGCKDWFIKEFGKAGFTVEIGRGKNPLPEEMLDEIYSQNAKIILCSMK